MLLGIAAWAGIAVAGIETARQSGEMRDLFQRLSTNQEVQDRLLAEYRLLLLERATLASYLNIESIATDDSQHAVPGPGSAGGTMSASAVPSRPIRPERSAFSRRPDQGTVRPATVPGSVAGPERRDAQGAFVADASHASLGSSRCRRAAVRGRVRLPFGSNGISCRHRTGFPQGAGRGAFRSRRHHTGSPGHDLRPQRRTVGGERPHGLRLGRPAADRVVAGGHPASRHPPGRDARRQSNSATVLDPSVSHTWRGDWRRTSVRRVAEAQIQKACRLGREYHRF